MFNYIGDIRRVYNIDESVTFSTAIPILRNNDFLDFSSLGSEIQDVLLTRTIGNVGKIDTSCKFSGVLLLSCGASNSSLAWCSLYEWSCLVCHVINLDIVELRDCGLCCGIAVELHNSFTGCLSLRVGEESELLDASCNLESVLELFLAPVEWDSLHEYFTVKESGVEGKQ